MTTVKPPKVVDSATAYAEGVVSSRIPANLYVRQACARHLNDLKRTDVWFDPTAGRRFERFCAKYLRHYKGPDAGKPVLLEPWQKFIFGCIYGWKLVIDEVKTDLWRFNIIYLEVPRKNGKTTISAAGAAYDCLMLEDTGAEVYCLATKEDQAKLLYNDVAAYISASPDLAEVFEILKGKNTIYTVDSSRTSFIKPLGSDSQRLDGLNPIAAYADELHAWPDAELWNVMKNAFGARTNWHMVAITTAGNNKEGICYKQREQLINILSGKLINDQKFGVIYTVDDNQREHWDVRKNWFIANPNLGTGKQMRYMESELVDAKQIPSLLNTFLNKQLNIWTDVAEAWLSMDTWDSRKANYTFQDMKYKRCVAAFDLARVNDLSAVAYVFPVQQGLLKKRIWADFYMPRERLKEKSLRDNVDYEYWEKQGLITITPGKTTDYDFIRRDMSLRAKTARVDKVRYDRHFAGELVTNLTNDGFKLEEIGMGFISLGAPTAELERALIEGDIEHPGHAILDWNAANTVVSKDATGAIKPDKDVSNKRIDGIMATVMALADLLKYGPQVSKYEKEGLLVVGRKS